MSAGRDLGQAGRWTGWVPVAVNHRGRPVPALLGPAITAAVLVVGLGIVVGRAFTEGGLSSTDAHVLEDLGGLVVVFLAGFYDDHQRGPHRGLRGHLLELARGRVTPGTVKLFAAVGAAALIAGLSGRGPLRAILGIPLMAGSANLWNLLDVRPGRAIKYFLLAAIVLAALVTAGDVRVMGGIAVAASLVALWPDLREMAMLGDSGSNVLGLVIGIALFRSLSALALGLALAAIMVLHLLAETVSFSRVIDALRPLRWFDRVGRVQNVAEDGRPRTSL